ncbi:MAG: ABC transporter ATP-binding protein [Candidatus Eiseniibacteriota bacterium]
MRRSDWALFRRLLGGARPYRLHLLALFANGLLLAPITMLAPLPLKIAVDSVLGTHPLPGFLPFAASLPSREVALAIAAGLLIATAFLRQLQQLADQGLRSYLIEKQTLDLRARVFLHAQRLSLAHHDRRGSTDAITRIEKDVRDAQSIVVESLFPSITAAFTVIGMLVVTARIDPVLALAAIAIAPMLFLMNQYYRRRVRVRWHEVRALETSALAVIQEVLGSLRVVKAFGQEEREQQRFLRRSGQGMWARLRLSLTEGGFGMLVGVVTALGSAVVLFVGILHVQARTLTLGELLLVMGYLTQLYEPLRTLSKRAVGLQSKLAGAERVFALLDDQPDVPERPGATALARARGGIEFQDVSFGYAADRPVLKAVSFAAPAGARVGIAGPTGAGKSTLVGLLLRLYDPTTGRILLDGVDLRDHRLQDLRRQFAMVLQEPVLFSTTVGENIAYARPDAGRDEVIEAAKAAHAHDFIRRLPQGYDTPVGERGMTLSGGERQRISLARAFLRDAPILILDEPTSAVDVRSEALIMEAIGRLMRGRTTFIVAHRLSTLEGCDLRLELEGGRLVSVGAVARAGRATG